MVSEKLHLQGLWWCIDQKNKQNIYIEISMLWCKISNYDGSQDHSSCQIQMYTGLLFVYLFTVILLIPLILFACTYVLNIIFFATFCILGPKEAT